MNGADRPPPRPRVRQAVVLVGGNRVFLDFLVENLARQGFDRILLLAGRFGEQIETHFGGRPTHGARVAVAIEPAPMGTGDALRWARDLLDERFLLLNGDAYFDINYRALEKALDAATDARVVLALRTVEDAAGYGSVELEGGRIRRFREKAAGEISGAGLINAGVYLMRRDVVDLIPERPASLEGDLFPALALEGRLLGALCNGCFIDVGSPDALTQARSKLPALACRPALFLDRDGVINFDHGYVHRWGEFDALPGAAETIAAFNTAGWFVFVVTNQAGVAHGYYEEAAIHLLHEQIRDWLASEGAHIDAFYYCPFHPRAAVGAYRADHPDRKPNNGMLMRAFDEWTVDRTRSLLIGDRESDLDAARAAGIDGYLFNGGRLDAFVMKNGLWPKDQDRRVDAQLEK